MSQAMNGNLHDLQIEYEAQGIEEGIKRYWDHINSIKSDKNKDNSTMTPESLLVNKIITPLAIEIRKLKTMDCRGGRGHGGDAIRRAKTFLAKECNLSAHHLAFLTAHAAINVHQGEVLQATAIRLGKNVISDQEYYDLLQASPKYLDKVESRLKTTHATHRRKVLNHCKDKVVINGTKRGITRIVMDSPALYHIGAMLIDCLCRYDEAVFLIREIITDSSKIRKPGKKTKHDHLIGRFKGLRPIPAAEKWMEDLHATMANFHALMWPMIVPPQDWVKTSGGGFLTAKKALTTTIINTRHTKDFIETAEKGDLTTVFNAVNAIQKTPFRINTRILEVMEWAKDRGRGQLPNSRKEEILDKAEPKPWSNDDEFIEWKETRPYDFKRIMASHAMAHDKWARENSKRTQLIAKLAVANKFKPNEKFSDLYFVYTLDFRGRIYPAQQFVNPIQDDAGRGLLEFAEGKPLGEAGADQLMINLANNYGYDKDTYEGRIQWVKDHHDLILDCAADPYRHSFWEDADKPFVFLAGCFEYAGFVAHGIDYVSHYICSADGTCSGVQHYSAMLKDEVAAPLVNLKPSDSPQDLYATVAEKVNEVLPGYDEHGSDDDRKFAKLWMDVGVERSETKRNCMTLAYGLSDQGFRMQVEEHIYKERGKKERFSIFNEDPELIQPAAYWLGNRNNEAVGKALPRPKAAMKFIQALSGFFGGHNLSFTWTAPNGLRVLHRYFKSKKIRLDSGVAGANIKVTLQVDTNKQDAARHRNGSAPNFIHSLDASHLMLTILKCEETGGADGSQMSYAFIHDSFGCHACDLPVMQANLRKAMVEMYSGNILEKFVQELETQVPDSLKEEWAKLLEENPMPTQGSFDINEVLDSPYLFN